MAKSKNPNTISFSNSNGSTGNIALNAGTVSAGICNIGGMSTIQDPMAWKTIFEADQIILNGLNDKKDDGSNLADYVTAQDDRLERIEKRLDILKYNDKLEGKHKDLQKLGEEYRALEAQLTTWELIKGDDT